MSWIQKLYETYEHCEREVWQNQIEDTVPLLPLFHTTQMADIEVVLNAKGEYLRAYALTKDQKRTIIPNTEESGGRAGSKIAPHPLDDNLKYVAKDCYKFSKVKEDLFMEYLSLLSKWAHSDFGTQKLAIVEGYVSSGSLISDLKASGLLVFNSSGVLDKGEENKFIRWSVEIPGDNNSQLHKDQEIQRSWIRFYNSARTGYDLCFVTGTQQIIGHNHSANIRNDGDRAKIISSNDGQYFTYRGLFHNADEACSIGYEVSLKAHNALRWLVGKQGYRRGDYAVVAWNSRDKDMPDPLGDGFSLMAGLPQSDSLDRANTSQEIANRLNKRIAGYGCRLDHTDNVMIMGMDAATPGRLAVTYYRELSGSDFLERIRKWHKECSWLHGYRKHEGINSETGKKDSYRVWFTGAPAPYDIAEAGYGRRIDNRHRKVIVERLLPCIIDGKSIPTDIVNTLITKASNRVALENWEWEKVLSITCALYRKYRLDNDKEEFSMALDKTRTSRDYLYGRLLAVADSIEGWALKEAEEKRPTNAVRYMNQFSMRPFTTWPKIEDAMRPYLKRLKGRGNSQYKLISEIMTLFEPDDFMRDEKLTGEYLLGYHCQRAAIFDAVKEAKRKKEEAKENEK